MKPTPSKFKKFLLPALVILVIIIAGLLIFKGGSQEGGAALFRGTTKADTLKIGSIGPVGSLNPNTQPLPCSTKNTTPEIKVMSPNGGEVFTAGQQITVKWSTCNIPANAQLQISMQYPFASQNITVPVVVNTGSATFTLPATSFFGQNALQYGNYYKIVVTAPYLTLSNGTSPFDISDNLFTINQISNITVSQLGSPTLTLVQPNPTTPDIYVAKFNFNVTANNDDIYISKNINNIGLTVDGNPTPAVTAQVIDSFHNLQAGSQDFLVPAGSTEKFTVSVYIEGTNSGGKVILNSLSYGLIDNSASMSYSFNPVFKTPTVYLAQ